MWWSLPPPLPLPPLPSRSSPPSLSSLLSSGGRGGGDIFVAFLYSLCFRICGGRIPGRIGCMMLHVYLHEFVFELVLTTETFVFVVCHYRDHCSCCGRNGGQSCLRNAKYAPVAPCCLRLSLQDGKIVQQEFEEMARTPQTLPGLLLHYITTLFSRS